MSEENVNTANVAQTNDENIQNAMPVSFEAMINQGTLTPEQALALQLQSMQGLPGMMPMLNPANFPRPTVKRRKPVKWELWEEKNLIEGVRRFGRGNWAQIRAAFEFQGCRTNVDLHDKWRVLTGERKRNRIAQRGDTSVLEGLTEAQKMQLVHGPNGLYNLQSSLLAGMPQLLDGQQFSAEFLQTLQLQQGEMLNAHAHGELTMQENLDLQQQHQEEAKAAEAEAAATTAAAEQPRKRSKKQKKVADESEVAKGLLKLSSDKKEEGTEESAAAGEAAAVTASSTESADTTAAAEEAKDTSAAEESSAEDKPKKGGRGGAKGGKASKK